MSTPHKASAEQWARCESDAHNWSGAFNCILELRARVEALEARPEQWVQCASALIERLSRLEEGYDELAARFEALEAAANSSVGLTSSTAAGSLVERVAATLRQVQTDSPWIPRWTPEARAAIREVADWLEKECRLVRDTYWVQRLRQEADR